jgi:hypothetical protein
MVQLQIHGEPEGIRLVARVLDPYKAVDINTKAVRPPAVGLSGCLVVTHGELLLPWLI